jgi:hypothetical protein
MPPVEGVDDGTTLYGVRGRSYENYGVVGFSDNGYAVFGYTDRSFGVVGNSSSGYGVSGRSISGYGVYGHSSSSTGVVGSSDNSTGVYGHSSNITGVYGWSSSRSRYSAGVSGFSTHGDGVTGGSTHGYGVYGFSSNVAGVYGRSYYGLGVFGDTYYGEGVYGSSYYGLGVYGYSSSYYGLYGESSSGYGLYSRSASGQAAYLDGNVRITGNLQKGGGSFQIDHPLDPANKYLSHSFVESPDMKNVYDGLVVLDDQGETEIELPDWFDALNKDFRYQLTAIGAPGPNLYIAKEIPDRDTNYSNSNGSNNNSRFKIAGGTSGMKVSWQVTGIRKDPWANVNRIQVEEDKPDKEKGYYIYPDLYEQPPEKGINHLLFPKEEKWQEQLIK